MTRRALASVLAMMLVTAACAAAEPAEPEVAASRTAPPPSAPPPTAPEGTRLVGMGRVVVAVPKAWVTVGPCESSAPGFVAFDAGACHRGGLWQRFEVPGLHITPARRRQDLVDSLRPSHPLQGRRVLESTLRCRTSLPPLCSRILAVPSENALFLFTTGAASDLPRTARVPRLVQLLPEGYTTVPFIELGTAVTDAEETLNASGLMAESPQVDFPHYVTGTLPPAGSVVSVGQTVVLTVGDG